MSISLTSLLVLIRLQNSADIRKPHLRALKFVHIYTCIYELVKLKLNLIDGSSVPDIHAYTYDIIIILYSICETISTLSSYQFAHIICMYADILPRADESRLLDGVFIEHFYTTLKYLSRKKRHEIRRTCRIYTISQLIFLLAACEYLTCISFFSYYLQYSQCRHSFAMHSLLFSNWMPFRGLISIFLKWKKNIIGAQVYHYHHHHHLWDYYYHSIR